MHFNLVSKTIHSESSSHDLQEDINIILFFCLSFHYECAAPVTFLKGNLQRQATLPKLSELRIALLQL